MPVFIGYPCITMVMRKIHGTIRRAYHTIGGMRNVLERKVELSEIRNIAQSLNGVVGRSKWSVGFEKNNRTHSPAKEILEDVIEDFSTDLEGYYTNTWHEIYKSRNYERHYFDFEHGFNDERPYMAATVTYMKKRELKSKKAQNLSQKSAKSLKTSINILF